MPLIPIYQVDAFAVPGAPFSGNPAAVCPLQSWLPEKTMQSIALENNLSETAFVVKQGTAYGLRWFTPKVEVDLCGHATLASGYVVLTHFEPDAEAVDFMSKSGTLTVSRRSDGLAMSLPAEPFLDPIPDLDPLRAALGSEHVTEAWAARNKYLVVFDTPQAVAELAPDFSKVARLQTYGVCATAAGNWGPGEPVDFISRYFAPAKGIDEDPVTGSAHCVLAPFWSERLSKAVMAAKQISERSGVLQCAIVDGRVELTGRCTPYLEGRISVEPGRTRPQLAQRSDPE